MKGLRKTIAIEAVVVTSGLIHRIFSQVSGLSREAGAIFARCALS